MAITVQMLVKKKSYFRRLMVGVLFVSYVFIIFFPIFFGGEGHSYVFPYSFRIFCGFFKMCIQDFRVEGISPPKLEHMSWESKVPPQSYPPNK